MSTVADRCWASMPPSTLMTSPVQEASSLARKRAGPSCRADRRSVQPGCSPRAGPGVGVEPRRVDRSGHEGVDVDVVRPEISAIARVSADPALAGA